jgi:hypothetical protein
VVHVCNLSTGQEECEFGASLGYIARSCGEDFITVYDWGSENF